MTKINFTSEQQEIYNKLLNFIKTPCDKLESNEYILVGYAGTGKTTLVTSFINNLINDKVCKKIAIAAPTHKAVNIVKSKLFNDTNFISTNINILTIHRLLNYQSYINLEGEKFFAKSKIEPKWNLYDLIIIDECSMLSNQIIDDIKEQLNNPFNDKIKIIYVGDPAQLPPVNHNDSKIFNRDIPKVYLDKIIRTNNQSIMELSNDHRKWILSKNINDMPHLNKYNDNNKIKLYSTNNNEDKKWLKDFIKFIKNNNFDETEINKIIENNNNNIILTWTNKKCNEYNDYVRKKIFNKDDLDFYEIGEILIFSDFYRKEIINEDKDKQNEIISFYTSEQVKVIDIKKNKIKLDKIILKKSNKLIPKINDKLNKYIDLINEIINEEINIYNLTVNKISDIIDNNIHDYDIITIHPDSNKYYNNICEQFETILIKLKKSCYKIINNLKGTNMNKSDLQSEVEKKINKLLSIWHTSVIDVFAQLNYGYCITVHKSQGSTFSNVFIDISDILDNKNISETTKCLYTGITRSSNTLNLLI
jgi:hypothetical protein